GWATFRERLGLTRDHAPAAEDGRAFTMILLTGREARVVSLNGTAATLQRLRFGSQGTDVEGVQRFLAGEGLYTGTVDGHMGPNTTMAWIRYQQRRDSGAADGIVTPTDGGTVGVSLGIGSGSVQPGGYGRPLARPLARPRIG